MKIVFASHNQKKAAEIRSVLPTGMSLLTLHDLELGEEIPENEPTIEGNSAFKANWVFQRLLLRIAMLQLLSSLQELCVV
ncbi:MAG: hypothetical protein LW804_06725 [Cryomorphaceae bacterium]|nr:hypothetical protein [Cryomorphaceae bacterium]